MKLYNWYNRLCLYIIMTQFSFSQSTNISLSHFQQPISERTRKTAENMYTICIYVYYMIDLCIFLKWQNFLSPRVWTFLSCNFSSQYPTAQEKQPKIRTINKRIALNQSVKIRKTISICFGSVSRFILGLFRHLRLIFEALTLFWDLVNIVTGLFARGQFAVRIG